MPRNSAAIAKRWRTNLSDPHVHKTILDSNYSRSILCLQKLRLPWPFPLVVIVVEVIDLAVEGPPPGELEA